MGRAAVMLTSEILVALAPAAWAPTPYASLRDIRMAAQWRDASSMSDFVEWSAMRIRPADQAKSCLSDLIRGAGFGRNGCRGRWHGR